MSSHPRDHARVIPLRPVPADREPLWRDIVGDVLRRERNAQGRTLKDVADAARVSMPYLSEVERGRKEASSEVLAAVARSLGLGLADVLSLAQQELTRAAGTAQTTGSARMARTARTAGSARMARSAPARVPMGEVRLAA